jgi:hypothetical protein
MGNDTSRATGTDFDATQRSRDRDNSAEQLPVISYLKQKEVSQELNAAIKESIYFNNYKRAFRGYLRRKPETNQMGALFRIHKNSLRDADQLGLPKDTLGEVVDRVVIKMAPGLNDDIVEELVKFGKLKSTDEAARKQRMAEDSLTRIFGYLADEMIETTGKKLYEKYSRGADFEVSDAEMDQEKLAKLQKQKSERLKQAADERQRQAEQFLKDAENEEENQRKRQEAIAQRQAEQKAIAAAAGDQAML